MAFSLRLIGDKELQSFFDRFPERVQKRMVKKAMRPAFKIALKWLKANYPKDRPFTVKKIKMLDLNYRPRQVNKILAGTLGSAERRPRRKRRMHTDMGVKIPLPSRAQLGIPASAKHYYPAVVEYGSRKRNIKPGAHFRKAVDFNASKIYGIYRTNLGRLIDEEARRS